MQADKDAKALAIWRQHKIPVVYRRGGGMPLMVKVPYAPDNLGWLKADHVRYPDWNPQYKCWETPNTWFNSVIPLALVRYGHIYVIQPFRALEKCAPACWHAEGFSCECSCMGANHGSESPGGNWFVVSETCALSWHERELACRLIRERL